MSPVGANIRGSRSSKDRCCSGISWVGVAGEEISSLRENWSFPSFSTSSQLQTLNGRLWVWSIKSTYSESDPWAGCGFCSWWKSWCLKGIFQKYRPPARPYLIDMVYTCLTDFLRHFWKWWFKGALQEILQKMQMWTWLDWAFFSEHMCKDEWERAGRYQHKQDIGWKDRPREWAVSYQHKQMT